MKVRPAKFSDSAEIVEIWNPYIKKTFVTFNASEKTQEEVCDLIKDRRNNGHEFWVAIQDDEIIGLKSTSIKFKNNPSNFLFMSYFLFYLALLSVGYLMSLNWLYFVCLIIVLLQLFYFQIKKLQIDNPESCLKIFKSNNQLGLIVFVSLLLGKI